MYLIEHDLLTYLKLLLVIQRRGHTTKNGSPVDAMLGDTNCLCEGEVDDCEVLRYAVQPPSSWTAPWSRPADSARGEVVQFQDIEHAIVIIDWIIACNCPK